MLIENHFVKNFIWNILICANISLIVNIFVKKDWFEKFPVLWSVMCLEYAPYVGRGWIMSTNAVENRLGGRLVPSFMMLWQEFHGMFVGIWLEDLVHGDLNSYCKPWSPYHYVCSQNFGSYLNYFFSVPAYFVL